MPKTIKEIQQDYTGFTTVEYSDGSNRTYTVDDLPTAVLGSDSNVTGLAVAGQTLPVIWTGTQSQYDAIAVKSSTVLYVIV